MQFKIEKYNINNISTFIASIWMKECERSALDVEISGAEKILHELFFVLQTLKFIKSACRVFLMIEKLLQQ